MGAAGGARLMGHARGGDREAAETRVPAQTGSHRAGDPVRMAGTEPALRDTGLPAANFKTNKVEKLSLELRKPDTREGCSRSHRRGDHARVPDDGPTQATPGVEARTLRAAPRPSAASFPQPFRLPSLLGQPPRGALAHGAPHMAAAPHSPALHPSGLNSRR